MSEKVELGKKYRHRLFGVEGIATAHVEYLTGCARTRLEWVKDKGDAPKELWADAPMLEKVGDAKAADVPENDEDRGGPGAVPPSRGMGGR